VWCPYQTADGSPLVAKHPCCQASNASHSLRDAAESLCAWGRAWHLCIAPSATSSCRRPVKACYFASRRERIAIGHRSARIPSHRGQHVATAVPAPHWISRVPQIFSVFACWFPQSSEPKSTAPNTSPAACRRPPVARADGLPSAAIGRVPSRCRYHVTAC
jgi:hypothetical protein